MLATTRTSGDAGAPRSRCRDAASRTAGQALLESGRHPVDLLEEERAALREVELAERDARAPRALGAAKRLEVWPAARRAQFTWMNGWRERGEAWWIARATASCPAPCGPVRTRASRVAA